MAIFIRAMAAVMIVTLLLTACTGSFPTNSPGRSSSLEVGTVRLAAFAPQALIEDYIPSATLENGGMKREVFLEPFSEGFVAEATGLPVGDWTLSVELHDRSGNLTHAASEKVRVYPGTETFVQMQVEPVDATFELIVDLSEFPDRDEVEGVRVSLSTGGYFTLSPVEDAPFLHHGQRNVRAGDYEFSVALYGATFYASDRLYQSPWETVRFHSGQTTQMQWTPTFGSTEVHIDVVNPPTVPTGIQCVRTADELWITWDPASVPTDGTVRIYARDDIFRPFSLIGEEDGAIGSWLLSPKDENSLAIVLTSVNARGDESYRSEPIIPGDCGI